MRLVIAEKRSVAEVLSSALKDRDSFKSGQGCFMGRDHIITWAFGHMVNSKPPSKYESFSGWNWESIPIIPPNGHLDYVVPSKTDFDKVRARQLKVIGDLYKNNDIKEVVNACDAEREGELIFWEIYHFHNMKAPVKRLWLQSTEESDARESFDNLKGEDFYEPRKKASYARQYADWLLGNNLTVAFTVKTGRLLHIGRVQTPTLSLLSKRRLEIDNFKPKPYFELEVEFGGKYKGQWFSGAKNNTKFDNKEDIEKIVNLVKDKDGLVIEKNVTEQVERPRPLFNLSGLQREANKRFGYTAKKTLDIAQELYDEYKVLSYPRTNSNFLMQSQVKSFPDILNSLDDLSYSEFSEEIIQMGIPTNKSFVDDKKVSDHYAIIPTRKRVNWDEFKDNPKNSIVKKDLENIYRLVVERFLSVFYPNAKYERTEIITKVENETFKTNGRIMIEEGWRKVLKMNPRRNNRKSKDTELLPPIDKDELNPVTKTDLQSKQTKPPSHYNDNTLIGAMERAREFLEEEELLDDLKEAGTGMELGTEATRANIIENLISRKYAERKGKSIIATDLGIKLIEVAPDNLKSPEVTAIWESKLKRIENKEFDEEMFREEIENFVTEEIQSLREKEISVKFEKEQSNRKVIGKCPKCDKNVLDYGKGVMCESSNQDHSCLKIWKTVARKKLSNKVITELIKGKETGIIRGFKTNTNRSFNAKLKMKEDYSGVEFVFPEAKAIFDCPKCSKPVYDREKFYSCESNTKENPCTFVPERFAGKIINHQIVKDLVLKGETEYLSFTSKNKYKYQAKLLYKNGKIEMSLKPRKEKETDIKCPECGTDVKIVGKVYKCETKDCKFVVFLEMSKKEITEDIVSEVLSSSEPMGPYKGFISKKGKSFDAKLAYDKEQKRIVFIF